MKYRYLLLLGNCVALTALAQHEGHSTTGAAAPEEQRSTDAPVVTGTRAATEADPPASPVMGAAPATEADPHAGHTMPAAPAAVVDPHAGHTMPAAAPAADMQGHDMAAMSPGDMLARDQPAPPEALDGPAYAADLVFNQADMAQARNGLFGEHGSFRGLFLMADQFEVRNRGGEDTYVWDAQGWYGGDIDKFWFKTEGEGDVDDSPEQIELQTLWSRAIYPWIDFQTGVRWDFESGFERSHLVLGFQGLVPYSFEVDAAAFISDEGDISVRFESEYDVWLTQRLILQPRLELEIAAEDIPERSMGAGLSSGEIGARLHYQVVREFAPYLGVEYERLFGGTADTATLVGKDTGGWNVILGVRTWF